jgi:exodeoxyribonuclease VII large subunit
MGLRLPGALGRAVSRARVELSRRTGRLVPSLLSARTERARERLDGWGVRLSPAARRGVERARDRLTGQARLLGSLGYHQTLKRGFAVLRDEAGGVVTDAAALAPGTAIDIELRDGHAKAVTAGGTGPAPKTARPGSKPAKGGGRQGSLF